MLDALPPALEEGEKCRTVHGTERGMEGVQGGGGRGEVRYGTGPAAGEQDALPP